MQQNRHNQLDAVYAGTFDPVTLGHIDVIKRAAGFLDKLYLAVAHDSGKDALFSVAKRVELVEGAIATLDDELAAKIEVCEFSGLLVDFVAQKNAMIIIRGMRAVADFEYEFQMASMNRKLAPNIETVFLTASENRQFISSRLVKEICRLGGDIDGFVTPNVAAELYGHYVE